MTKQIFQQPANRLFKPEDRMAKKLLVTGSSGLMGEVTEHFCHLGWEVCGFDNNMRADFFGPRGDLRAGTRRDFKDTKLPPCGTRRRDRARVLLKSKTARRHSAHGRAAEPRPCRSPPFDDSRDDQRGRDPQPPGGRKACVSGSTVCAHVHERRSTGTPPTSLHSELPTAGIFDRRTVTA
jgi:CDP-paratose 2-epimerase